MLVPHKDMINAFFAYMERTALGTARGLYRAKGIEIQDHMAFITEFHPALCIYLNNCYASLLLEDDAIVVKDCAPFKFHSPVCLFNLMREMIMKTLRQMDFTTIDFTALATFSSSFESSWKMVVKSLHDKVSDRFMHNCTGPQIADCDPTKPLFVIVARMEEVKQENVKWFCVAPSCHNVGYFCCSKCKRAFYCCKQHQREHWPTHKKNCVQPKALNNK